MEKKIETEELIDLGDACVETKGPGGQQVEDGANIKFNPLGIYAD